MPTACFPEAAEPSSPVKRFLITCLVLAGSISAYWLVSVPYLDRLSRLFSVEYEIPVEVRKAEKTSLALTLTARGQLEPIKEVKAVATVPGVIKEIRYLTGDRVIAGAVVAVVEAQDLAERIAVEEAAVKETEANLQGSESRLAAAETQLADTRDLYGKNFIARRDVELAEAAVKTARIQKEAVQAQLAQRISMLAQTRHALGLARVTVPVGGIVTRRWAEPGALVTEAAPILSVAPMETLRMIVNMKSRDAEKLRPGTVAKVKVDVPPERDFRGVVTQIHETANFTGDELSVEVEVANPAGALKFGMPASVFFLAGERRNGIFVPSTALINGDVRPGVYVNEGGIARQRYITPGERNNGEIEVVSGLEPGDAVIVNGAERLVDGSRVRVVE